VLVHGAGHGGWCWCDVAAILRASGHDVTTPTLSGLGERAHLLNETIDLETHLDDLANHLVWEDLWNVVLVGHSYGGAVVAGVADRLRERIAHLILLDAFFMLDGETCMDQVDADVAAERVRLAQETSNGLMLPDAPPSFFGVVDTAQQDWLASKLTAHPLLTYTMPLRLQRPLGDGLHCDYIACVDPAFAPMARAHQRAREAGWPVHALETGHDAMVSAPVETADLLERIAAGSE